MRTLLLGALAALSLGGVARASYTPPMAFFDTSITQFIPTVGQTVAIPQNVGTAIITPAGLLLTLTISLPVCSPQFNGQFARFSTTQAVTTLTLNAQGGTVLNPVGSLLSGGFGIYACMGSNSTWYRVG